jgi:hypothetical protein
MARLIKTTALEWPAEAGWLVPPPSPEANCTALQYAVILRAMKDVGILEVPLGSNRGVRIERYLRRANVPESLIRTGKGWWCAAEVGAVFLDCGIPVPADYASVDSWLPYLAQTRTIGSAVVYGVRGDGHHIGIIARLSPMVLTIEGNRGFAGTTNNGVACDIGPMQRKDILGYISPEALIRAWERQGAA